MMIAETVEEGGMISYPIGVRFPYPSSLKAFHQLTFQIQADRHAFPPREDLPLPTQPPYTAFVGNLAFDLTEHDLESFFAGLKVRSAIESG